MALTEEQKRKALEDMKKNQKDINKSKENDNKQSADDIIAKQQKTIESLKERLGESEKNSKNLKNENTHLKSEVDAKVDSKTQVQQEKALNDVDNNGFVVMLLRLNFFGSKERKSFFDKHMPETCFVHHQRIGFADKKDSSGYVLFDKD